MSESKLAESPRARPAGVTRRHASPVGVYSAQEFLEDQRDVLAAASGDRPTLVDTMRLLDGCWCRIDFSALQRPGVRSVATVRFLERYGVHSAVRRDAYLSILRFLDDYRGDVIRNGLAVREGQRLAIREEFLDHLAKAAGVAGGDLVSSRVIVEFLNAWDHRWM